MSYRQVTPDAEPKAATNTLRRALGVWAAAAFVVTNMVGTGIFTVPAFVRTATGNGLATLGVWALGGVLALSGALCFAELATRMPEAGGEYRYLTQIYGRLWGFVSGWISFLVGFSAAIAASALGASAYAATLFPAWNPQTTLFSVGSIVVTQGSIAAACLIAALAAFHSTGVRPSGRLQTVIAALVVGAIVILFFAGIATGKGNWSGVTAGSQSTGLWWVALIQVSFAYSGWNAAAYLAGEVKDPRHTLPRALIGGTLTVTVLYLILNVLFLYALPASDWQPNIAIGKLAAEHMFGSFGATVVSVIITLTILGSVSSMTAAGPRVYYAMARDKMAPAIFGRVGQHGGAPMFSIITQAAVAILLVLTGEFENLLIYAGSALSLMAALTVTGVWVVRRTMPADSPTVFLTPGYPVTPAIFLLLEAFAITQGVRERPLPTLAALGTIAAGIGIFFIARAFGWMNGDAPSQHREK